MSPIHGDARKVCEVEVPEGTTCELLCPVSGKALERVGKVLPNSEAEYCAIYLSPRLDKGPAIYISNVWGHYHSRVVHTGELISHWAAAQ